jgi:RHS repeat-associated protein
MRALRASGSGASGNIDPIDQTEHYYHVVYTTWDGDRDPRSLDDPNHGVLPVITCRTDGVVDNDLCRQVVESMNDTETGKANGITTADGDTSWTYNPEGQHLTQRQRLQASSTGSASNVDSTWGYHAQYVGASATTTYDDTVAGGGAVTSPARSASALYVVSDQVQSLPPRGNAPGAAASSFRTDYRVDDATSAAPNSAASSACGQSNTGLVCEVDAPAATGASSPPGGRCAPAADRSTPYACTRFTYDAFGQRATAATPLAEAGSAPVAVTRYTYYGDGDTDLTGQVSAGGWLRAVADASANCAGSGCFVAFAYDRGGNQTRSWDRNATRGHAVTDGWTSLVSPPATAYAEVVRGTGATAYSAPWRYARSQRDQVADTTTVAVDANGNPTTTTPPRGTAAGSTSYDITSTYDANDNLASRKLPADSAAVQFTYDEFDNRSTEVDADGSTTLWLYDAVNRNNETRWSRSASAGDAVGACTVPAAGTAGASGLEGHVVCSTTRSFDGLDDVIVSADGNHQNTTFSYDSLGRQTDSFAPRDANTTEHTASVYDLDGNVVEVCSPRNFDPAAGNSTTCANGALYGRYATYDKADRMATATAYRDATTPITTGTSYDADGNVVSTTDGNNHTTTAVYDILDRRVSATTPRDANHHETTAWSYDAAGNVTAVSMPGSVDTGTGADGALVVDGASGTAPDGVPHPAANPYRIPTGKNYTAITLQNGGYATSAGSDLDVKATGSVVICSTCSLTVAGLGSAGGAGGSGSVVNGSAGQGPGAGGGGVSALTGGGGGGGGGHATGGTAGANSAGTGGAAGGAYGDAMTSAPTVSARGSGGGGGGGAVSAGGAGGAGGGYVRLQAATIDIEGAVSADGGAGVTGAGAAAGGGGGSGGGIWLTAPAITLGSATALSANGGMGGGGGGAGGLGRIRVDVDALSGAGASSVPPGTTAQTTRDLASRVTAYSYDAANRPIDTVSGAESLDATDPAQLATGGTNTRTRRAYDQDGNVVATFDARAFTASTSSPDPRFMARTDYDEDGRPTAQYVPRFDGSAASDTAGSSSAVQRNQCATGRAPQAVAGVPTWPADVGVCVSRVTYDGNGNITRITMPTAVGTGNRFITLTYFDDNLLKQVKPPSPATGAHDPAVTHVYDGDGRELQATDATLSDGSSLTTKTTYTLDGLVDTTSEWSGSTDLGHTFHYGYDADGHPTTSQDPKTYVTTTSYTVDGLVSSVKQPGATASDFDTTSYIYDSVGNATAITSPSGNAGDANNTAMTPTRNTYYDDNLLNTSTAPVASDGSTSKVSSYRYDAAGRKISQDVVALGQDAGTQTLSYLPNDRLASEVGRGGAERLDFGYDAAGDAVTASDQASSGQVGGTVAMTYYLDGLLRTAVDGTAGTGATTTALAYDGYGSPTYRSQTPAGGAALKTTYTYLDAELPSTLTSDVTGGQTSWTYKANGKVQTESDPNGESRSYTYNPDETLQSAALNVGTTNVATYSYSYDELQRVRSQSYTSAAANAGPFNGATYGYDYEPSGRLSSFSDSSGTSLVTWDHDGNRLKFGTKRSATYNADDTVKNDTRPDPTDPTGAATTTKLQVYDAARRLADDGCSTYTYDGLDRLSQVAPKTVRTACAPTTTTVGYRYDALDRQVSRAESGSPGAATETLHYDGSSEALDREASSATAGGAPLGTNTYELDAANSPKALTESKVGAKPLEYLTDDGMGNVATLTDATGAVDCDARYDPFGDAEQPAPANADPNCNAGSTPNDVFYHGARRDAATGDYQFGSRTYDPSKSAFLTPDSYRAAPSGGDLSVGIDPLTRNTYSFVNGDPVNLVDPTGHASSCGPNISPSMCRSNSEDFRHEAEVEEAQNFLRHCSYEQCRSERNSFVDDGYADVSPLAAPHKKKAGLLSGLWHGAVHAAKKAGAAVVAGVEYCLGKGARTCATVAAAVAIAATGVGALVEAGGLLAVGVASVAASEFLTGAAAFVSAAGIGASAGFAGAAYSKSHSLTEFIAPAGAVLGEFGPSLGGDPDPPAAEEGGGASSAADGARLSEHLRQLEEYGDTGFKELENGRIRYYGEIDPADKPGEMVGRRLVREWDPETGYRRTWHETVDQSGRVRIVRPETGGPKVHYFFDEYGNYEGSW